MRQNDTVIRAAPDFQPIRFVSDGPKKYIRLTNHAKISVFSEFF